ncbi:hypothetical protein A8139_11245 [Marinomonas primoryensis]|uniref:Antitoxin Xre/MbcA/ParS-like toxin-binding domain-containing protein n=1 Tax=Marinomonas primoryensis TaxID=178399 RepID=A0A2Z4PSE7_9GAMM|nr:antitoxin Xre/MbcA/ParS toxin-binding domain-containing protein [Marinomonas primoryensis]AWY00501.1 hypothetical protein A8139_11245 [Marinomonas primoryensis]
MKALESQSQLNLINSLFPGFDIMRLTDYLSIVRSGVSGEKLQAIIKLTGEKELIAHAIGKSVSSISRSYHVKRLSPAITDSLIDTLRVYIQVVRIYGSVDLASEWIHSPIPALGGEVPANILDTA